MKHPHQHDQVLENCKPIGEWLTEHGLPLNLLDPHNTLAKQVGARWLLAAFVCYYVRWS